MVKNILRNNENEHAPGTLDLQRRYKVEIVHERETGTFGTTCGMYWHKFTAICGINYLGSQNFKICQSVIKSVGMSCNFT